MILRHIHEWTAQEIEANLRSTFPAEASTIALEVLANYLAGAQVALLHGWFREWLRLSAGVRRLGGISMILLLAAGFYMMAFAQINAAWLVVAFFTLIVLSVLAVALTGRRMTALRQAVTAVDGSVSPATNALRRDPLLLIAMRLRVALALGIVFLMTIKPNSGVSLLTIGITAIVALASAIPLALKRDISDQPANMAHTL